MAALGLPLALVVGIVVELVAGLVSWGRDGSRWWSGVAAASADARAVLRGDPKQRISVVEGGGAVASLAGAGLAGAAVLGVIDGSMVLVYLALTLAAGGSMLAASAAATAAGERRLGRERLLVALAEPAFALALGVMFVRLGAGDLEAARGAQAVLGPAVLLLPTVAAAGLVVAALVAAAAGALRLPRSPEPAPRPGHPRARPAGTRLATRLCRWGLAGATCLVVAVLLAGGPVAEPGGVPVDALLPFAAATAGMAVALGAADALLRRVPARWAALPPAIALVLGAGAAAAVVLA